MLDQELLARSWRRLAAGVLVSLWCVMVSAAAQTDLAESGLAVTETQTESQRSLFGGFWKHSTSTKTTTAVPRVITLDEVETGTLLFRTEEQAMYVEALRLDTKAAIEVTGMIARVVVTQSFANPSDQWLEGIYAFPLPEDAAVDALEMRIGDTVISGAIMEKEQARQAYEQAKREGTRASVVEQTRPNLFRTSVANIAPRDTVHIEISYLETLSYDQGSFSLRFPLSITPRFSPSNLSAGMLPSSDPVSAADSAPPPPSSLAEITVRLNAGFPLRSLVSDSHDVKIEEKASMHYLTLRDVAVPMDRDFELSWRPAIGAEPGAAVFTEELDGTTYAKVMFMPPQQRGAAVSIPRETVIIVDTSGSMAGASFDQAVRAVDSALDMLSEDDYFNIVRFSNSHAGLFTRAQPATQANLNQARRFLRGLRANGGTNMGPPLEEALTRDSGVELLKQVVFITDGAVDNEQELFALIYRELGQSRLFTVGIGAAPNSYFMRKAAETGRGTYTYIGSTEQVGKRMQGLFKKLESPVLKDIQVQWPGRNTDVTPTRIPDLYLSEPLVVSAKLDGSASAIKISGMQAGRSWNRELALGNSLNFRGVSTLWARDKVSALMDGLSRGETPENVRASVVPLALRHHLVTKYTSLVALDDRPVRDMRPGQSVQQASVGAPVAGVAHAANSGSAKQLHYPTTASAAPIKRAAGLVLLLLALMFRSRRIVS